jgi:hypothetical protein
MPSFPGEKFLKMSTSSSRWQDWEKDIHKTFWRKFYEDPEVSAPTPTGKLELYSQALADNFPTDMERPPSLNGLRRVKCMMKD